MRKNARERRRGSALLTSTIIVVLVVGLGGAFLSLTLSRSRAQHSAILADEAMTVCEAGLEMARRALVEWRNRDASAWNELLQYCRDLEQQLSGTVSDPSQTTTSSMQGSFQGPGGGSSPSLSPIVSWKLTSLPYIKQEYFEALKKDSRFRTYSADASNNTVVPSDYKDLLGRNFPFNKGAYHIVMVDNDDVHGNGVDDDGDGDPWNPDTAGEQAAANRDPAIDGDRSVFLIVTATLRDGTQRQIVSFVEYPSTNPVPPGAVLSNGTINLQGAFQILGAKGMVQANEDVRGNGSAQAVVQQSINASGTASITMSNRPPGGINSNQPPIPIDRVDLSYYLSPTYENRSAIVILGRNGGFYKIDAAGNRVPATDATYPFSRSVDSQTGRSTWTISGRGSVPPRIYFVEGDFKMTGQGNTSPYEMTLIVDGHVHLGGNSKFAPWKKPDGSSSNTLVIANGDVQLRGTGTSGTVQYQGVVLANEQVEARGNYTLEGSLIAVNATDTPGSLVSTGSTVEPDLTVGGSVTIKYDGKSTILPPPARALIVRSVRRVQ
jgi:type II secretory pathway pseudopilin PulG